MGLVGTTTVMGGAVTFLGKVFVTASTTFAMFAVLKNLQTSGEISNYYFPLAVCIVGAYFTASMFMNVFDTGIDTETDIDRQAPLSKLHTTLLDRSLTPWKVNRKVAFY